MIGLEESLRVYPSKIEHKEIEKKKEEKLEVNKKEEESISENITQKEVKLEKPFSIEEKIDIEEFKKMTKK